MSLAVLDGGTFYHAETIGGKRYSRFFDKAIYAPECTPADLEGVRLLIVPDRMNPSVLRHLRPALIDYLQAGNTLVILGETQPHTWAPGVEWSFRPTNYWWWQEKGAQPPQRILKPEHEIFRFVNPKDTIWHFHGVLHPPAGAETVIDVPGDPDGRDRGGALLYDDRVTTRGRMIVATLDPFYHHGSHFMPATTKFLDGFLEWARAVT